MSSTYFIYIFKTNSNNNWYLKTSQQTSYIDPMLFQCWSSVCDISPTLNITGYIAFRRFFALALHRYWPLYWSNSVAMNIYFPFSAHQKLPSTPQSPQTERAKAICARFFPPEINRWDKKNSCQHEHRPECVQCWDIFANAGPVFIQPRDKAPAADSPIVWFYCPHY